ncbi:RNase adapter RapZ [Spectribacter hydrogenoxidans]|uniref:RNase adapter RapZ n=1 Tax=Spectribacter hydrogenoxidans TaxID=3075608 RepID=A0ABU3BX10_9GAMM|nr:RNase adapter RapZ [Salinisphaera sp. W335]MDT0633839.1 RNase adapter RapZ [Salinisphaera sp. W335]
MRLIIVSGLAGSGKSVALGMLEDLGYYCIDNLPITLLRDVTADSLRREELDIERLAVGVDARARSRQIAAFPEGVTALRAGGLDVQVLYLEADDEVILRRYGETRRKHPLTDAGTPLVEAVRADRDLMRPIADQADLTIDTSRTNIHQLRELIRTRVEAASDGRLSILLQSFGFKYGVPDAVDFVFDVRCLPNPHWETDLREATGRDPTVAEFLEKSQETVRMRNDIAGFIEAWLPAFERENRAYITIAIGCTGGRHRSVYLVERIHERLRERYPRTQVKHTELP